MQFKIPENKSISEVNTMGKIVAIGGGEIGLGETKKSMSILFLSQESFVRNYYSYRLLVTMHQVILM